ncbi:hypothetical protein [Streptomyces sp. NPDC001927]
MTWLAVSELAAVVAAVVQTVAVVVQLYWHLRSYHAGTALGPEAAGAAPAPASAPGPVCVRITILPPAQVEISVTFPEGNGAGLGPRQAVKENGPW